MEEGIINNGAISALDSRGEKIEKIFLSRLNNERANTSFWAQSEEEKKSFPLSWALLSPCWAHEARENAVNLLAGWIWKQSNAT